MPIVQGRQTENSQHRYRWPDPPLPLPRWLDVQADAELQAGNVARAERLAHQAAELRLMGADRQQQQMPRS